MHPWHDISIGTKAPEEVIAVVEIPKGSNKKYELDRKTGKFRVDRVLPKGLKYPLAYGFIPRTMDDDGDALDIMIVTKKKLKRGDTVKVNPIALLHIFDNERRDDKIIAVLKGTRPSTKKLRDEIRYFFKAYKTGIIIKGWLGKKQAYKEIKYCISKYRKRFRG